MRLKGTRARLTALVLVLVVGLVALGVAYAQWTASLTINGTVNTGSVDGSWTEAWCLDNETPPPDVGTVTVTGTGTQILTVAVDNAYPSYEADCSVKYTIGGSIPVKIKTLTMTEPPGGEIDCTFTDGASGAVYLPGELVASNFKIHVTASAAPNSFYECKAEIELVPFNDP